jgi:hypothetical protein
VQMTCAVGDDGGGGVGGGVGTRVDGKKLGIGGRLGMQPKYGVVPLFQPLCTHLDGAGQK